MDLDDDELRATLILNGAIKKEKYMTRFEIAEAISASVNEKDIELPKRSTKFSAGYDLKSPVEIMIPAQTRARVPLGITCKMKDNEYLAIVPRSGLALKHGVTVLNTPGTIDSDYYPAEISVILYNTSDVDFTIKKGDKVAQAILSEYKLMENDEVIDKKREGGFGSTGR